MARPSRCRRICTEPDYVRFEPSGAKNTEPVFLTVDEYEAVRLIDFEKRTHEQCAAQMGVSRTTVTEMYERAREKIADCLVNGRTLQIGGGNYMVCDGSAKTGCAERCDRAKRLSIRQATDSAAGKEEEKMKIAVTYENGNVFPHFGHTEQFKVYEAENGEVTGAQVMDTNGSGHGALAGMLAGLGVDTLILTGASLAYGEQVYESRYLIFLFAAGVLLLALCLPWLKRAGGLYAPAVVLLAGVAAANALRFP